KTLNESTENLKKQYGNAIEPETSEEGDNLNGELIQEVTEYKEETWIFTERLIKKEAKKFYGLKVGDIVSIDPKKIYKEKSDVAHLLKKKEEELSDINGDFQFKVTKITRVETAELNQEFFDKVLGKDAVKSEDEFRSKLKETLEDNYNREAESYNNKLLKDKLVETTKMEIPEEFYKKWLITASKADIKEEDLEKNFGDYVDDLKWTLITQRIETDNSVKAENDEVVDAAKNMIRSQFAAYGMPEELENQLDSYAQNYLTSNNGENYMQLYNTVKTEKIIRTIRDQMDISYKKVKPEEFSKIVSN
ncbi:trigger factor, partial [Bacteroidota bacterium]